jgi:hypothetical protein
MILHKLVFFRLPYRWAAYGDRPGLYGSDAKSLNEDDEKADDTDRLEREVSSYPGFKSTARLETLFTSRRLPRSYLVLLESLLNVSPVTRPTCEKVLAALHLGKVCSLIIDRPTSVFRTSSQLVCSSIPFRRSRTCQTLFHPGRDGHQMPPPPHR